MHYKHSRRTGVSLVQLEISLHNLKSDTIKQNLMDPLYLKMC